MYIFSLHFGLLVCTTHHCTPAHQPRLLYLLKLLDPLFEGQLIIWGG